MNAASPGVISAFQSNRYYPSHDAYVDAIAAAMKPEYDAIAAAGFVLQLDCPDLAMARHTGFQELGEAEFLRAPEYQVEALNHAVRDIPADRMRMHICWGQLRRPARPRHSRSRRSSAIVLEGQAGRHPVRGREPAASARVGGVGATRSCPTTRC